MSKVLYEQRGAIAEVKLNRPDKLNAIDDEMLDGLEAALETAATDDSVRVLLLSGEGRAFSAGFDLSSWAPRAGESREESVRRELRRDFDFIMRVWDFPKPIVAAVHGFCLGSSLEVTAVADITIAAEDCRFGVPEVRFGSGAVCLILPWIIGLKNARELLLTGSDRIDAKRAAAIGLVNHVVSSAGLMQHARDMASEIALNDPVAVRLTKKAINRTVEIAGLRDALEEALAIDLEIELTATPESNEFNRILQEDGPKAALEWRASQSWKQQEGEASQ
jgi:enoyl-CoA hydratase